MRSINELRPLSFENGGFLLNCKKPWGKIVRIQTSSVRKVAQFAHEMTSGNGAHRDHRTGGTFRRSAYAIFHDTFNGKLCEVGVHETLVNLNDLNEPISELDFSVSPLGIWDGGDIRIGRFVVQVKSTKSFGNLLLMEAADWNERAEYLPGNAGEALTTDLIIMARIRPSLWETFATADYEGPFSEFLDKISGAIWEIDVVGFATKEDIQLAITSQQLIPKNALFQRSTYMDADNYYIQAGDLWDITLLGNYIRSRTRETH